jgi:uncharacterized protein (TIGR03790 family)
MKSSPGLSGYNAYLGRKKAFFFPGAIFLLAAIFAFFTSEAVALAPEEVMVVANRKVPQGVALAEHYMSRRQIPAENLILLEIEEKETCSRDDYLKKIAVPLRDFLYKQNRTGKRLRCLTLMYGLPLKISPPSPSPSQQILLKQLRIKEKELAASVKEAEEKSPRQKEEQQALGKLKQEIAQLQNQDQEAALDSELALVLVPEHPLSGWLDNPLFVANIRKPLMIPAEEVLFVSRLDGPDPETVQRIIKQSLEAEKTGLSGKVYLDARWKKESGQKDNNAYKLYDLALHRTASLLKKRGFTVSLDESSQLFPAGSNLEASLYCGWYSLARYVDAFAWQPGSIGYHIASSECATLKKKNSRVWCKLMLEKGIAATIGPVSEPYLQAFPPPDIFFDLLTKGEKTLAECYMQSLPFLSWKMVLIGDPLYNPFARR